MLEFRTQPHNDGMPKILLFARRNLRLHGVSLGWVSAGKLAVLIGNGLLVLFLSQRLNLNTYGIFVAMVGAQTLLSRVLMLGVETGMISLKNTRDLLTRSEDLERAGFLVIARG